MVATSSAPRCRLEGENQIIVDQPIEYDARFLIHI
jgi:hypothetical protein